MGLKPGFMRTEVGIIPQDWVIVKLDDVSMIVDSLHQTPSFVKDGYAMVRVTDIKTGNLDLSGTLKVRKEVFEFFTRTYQPKRNDIVLSRVGSYGVSSFVETDEPFCMGQNTVVIRPTLPSRFLYYVLNSYSTKCQIDDSSFGSGYKSLSLKNIKGLFIPIPPTEREQRAIAKILGDVDSLIESLEKLIVKKRNLKQAVMQQLLTGKTRLRGCSEKMDGKSSVVKPGYKRTEVGVIPEDWDILPFKKQFKISAGGDVKPKLSSVEQDELHRYPIYSNALTDQGLYGYCSYADHPAHSITITARGTLGVATYRDHKYTAIGRVLVLEPKRQSAGLFFAEFINSRIKFAIESTGVPQLTSPQIGNYFLAVPPYPEQHAIAEVLSDMDADIDSIKQRLDKTHALKQGMMQELLTGRIRLI